MAFELFIGGRYLRAKQRQGFISLITVLCTAGVAVGVMALIVVLAVMAGFESDLKARILGVQAHVSVSRNGRPGPMHAVSDRLTQVPGVVAVTPVVRSQTMLRSAAGMAGARITGVDPVSVGKVFPLLACERLVVPPVADSGSGGKTAAADPGIILGRELAKVLGVREGDGIHLLAPRGMLSPVGHLPSVKRFRVVALFTSGMYEYDVSMAWIHLTAAQKLARMPDAISGLEVRVQAPVHAGRVARRISDRLGAGYVVSDWTQKNRNLFAALRLEKTVMFIILTLIVLVAAFNITSTLIMMVMEKTRDIAILKAMGAGDGSIRKIFVFNGMAIGALGTLVGAGLGFVLCFLLQRYHFIELPADVYYITTVPVRLEILDSVLVVAAALLICLLATFYPARQASKLSPVEAIRYG